MGTFHARMPFAGSTGARAQLLREEAAALSSATTIASGQDGSGALLAFDETVLFLLEADRKRTDEMLRWDRILNGCITDLSRPIDDVRVSVAASSLPPMADRMDVLERRIKGGGALRFMRGGAAALVAVGIAGATLAASASVLTEPTWLLPGLITCAAGFGPLLVLILLGVVGQRAAMMEQRRLGAHTLDVLARARIVLTDETVPSPNTLREHAASIGRRDLVQDLRSRLQGLVLDEDGSARLGRRRDVLGSDIDDERALDLVSQRSQDPVMAVAGLRRAMHKAFERVREHGCEAGRSDGIRLGAAEALRREATRLEKSQDDAASAQTGGRIRAIRDAPHPDVDTPRRVRLPGTARALASIGLSVMALRRRRQRVGAPVEPQRRDTESRACVTAPATADGGATKPAVWPPAALLRTAARRAEQTVAPLLAACAPEQSA